MTKALSYARVEEVIVGGRSIGATEAMTMAIELRDLRRVYRVAKRLHARLREDGVSNLELTELGGMLEMAEETTLPVVPR